MKNALIASLLLGASLLAPSALALTAEQTVEREIVVMNADGSETVKREKADMVTPGEKIVYSINYFNELEKPAENVVLVMPVPEELKIVEGSADMTGAITTYSADGGNSFTSRDELQITLADNTTQSAQANDITHVKWVVAAINPGERGSLSFKGILE